MAKILIVDDDEGERLLLQACLERDHELVFAREGEAATEIVNREPIDLLITDLAMPQINGLRLIKALREDGETMPIIAVSGSAPEQLDLAVEYGANAVLYKPIELAELRGVVKALLSADISRWDPWGAHRRGGSSGNRRNPTRRTSYAPGKPTYPLALPALTSFSRHIR